MKYVLYIIGALLILSAGMFILPAALGLISGYLLFTHGHCVWGIICAAAGVGYNIFLLRGRLHFGRYDHDGDCPYCGSGDTDGNHCYNCGRDF